MKAEIRRRKEEERRLRLPPTGRSKDRIRKEMRMMMKIRVLPARNMNQTNPERRTKANRRKEMARDPLRRHHPRHPPSQIRRAAKAVLQTEERSQRRLPSRRRTLLVMGRVVVKGSWSSQTRMPSVL